MGKPGSGILWLRSGRALIAGDPLHRLRFQSADRFAFEWRYQGRTHDPELPVRLRPAYLANAPYLRAMRTIGEWHYLSVSTIGISRAV
jgi:hypothetical protein